MRASVRVRGLLGTSPTGTLNRILTLLFGAIAKKKNLGQQSPNLSSLWRPQISPLSPISRGVCGSCLVLFGIFSPLTHCHVSFLSSDALWAAVLFLSPGEGLGQVRLPSLALSRPLARPLASVPSPTGPIQCGPTPSRRGIPPP